VNDLSQIETEIASLQAKAEAIRAEEVARIQASMAAFGIKAKDLEPKNRAKKPKKQQDRPNPDTVIGMLRDKAQLERLMELARNTRLSR
jgi:hypothetical protein